MGRWALDPDGKLLFGRHKGRNVEDVADESPGLRWCLREVEIPDCDAEVIRTHLVRRGELNEGSA